MQKEITKSMTTSQKQVFAAKCLSEFCKEKGIVHDSITVLIEHLISIESCKNIVDWERKGAQLELVGRGEDLPESVASILELKDKNAFIELLDAVVEVGIADMYGAETQNPTIYLEKTISILEKSKVSLPKN